MNGCVVDAFGVKCHLNVGCSFAVPCTVCGGVALYVLDAYVLPYAALPYATGRRVVLMRRRLQPSRSCRYLSLEENSEGVEVKAVLIRKGNSSRDDRQWKVFRAANMLYDLVHSSYSLQWPYYTISGDVSPQYGSDGTTP